jgi:hypothetical protein
MAPKTQVIKVTPTLTVHASYVTGDYVGTSASAMEFASASNIGEWTGTIVDAVLIDYAVQSIATELWLFSSAPTPPADSAAWSISDADAAKCIGVVAFPAASYYASALNSVCRAGNVVMPFKATSGSIYGCLVTRGSPTYADGDLTVRLTIFQD